MSALAGVIWGLLSLCLLLAGAAILTGLFARLVYELLSVGWGWLG